MSTDLSALSAAVAARFGDGDEDALITIFRQQYEGLLAKAGEALGSDLAHFRGRVAEKAMLDAWKERARLKDPAALASFLKTAIDEEGAIQRSKSAALHRHGPGSSHISVPGVEEAVSQLRTLLRPPEIDHQTALAEARAVRRAHSRTAAASSSRGRWVFGTIGAVVVGALILYAQRWVNKQGEDAAIDRAFRSGDIDTQSSLRGQRGKLTLRDGTKASLGAETRLSIPSDFAVSQRTIMIEGAATFDVGAPDAAKPMNFAVRAANATITSDGTVFTVRYYADEDSSVFVEVTDGSVTVRDRVNKTEQKVTAGSAISLKPDGTFGNLSVIERDVALAWTRDSVVYENTPLRIVIPDIARWFGIKAALADSSISERPVSMRVALASSGDAVKALSERASLSMSFGKGDVMEFRDISAAPPAKGKAKK